MILTRERIIETTIEVLRKYGPQKTSVTDVAKVLGVSHGTIYRHFENKAALKEAVLGIWLKEHARNLERTPFDASAGRAGVEGWIKRLVMLKHDLYHADPELFDMYTELTAEAAEAVEDHLAELVTQLETRIALAQRTGSVTTAMSAREIAEGLFYGTARFHHPTLSFEWRSDTIHDQFEVVTQLLFRALEP
ncbi:TetR/AcrR family transcriptional regulator [Exiguobacterium flavidum]|uniref:TetR/AcrR family transcriptional regulator n=1 Tax=Exiguobacterium flavidum TaxID=2184695 RepID=UPI000DF74AE7|nr:TetR/AcrR family transcriptional regulator [Exiguobacterium flavidum]